jgi:hypothetical protein
VLREHTLSTVRFFSFETGGILAEGPVQIRNV